MFLVSGLGPAPAPGPVPGFWGDELSVVTPSSTLISKCRFSASLIRLQACSTADMYYD